MVTKELSEAATELNVILENCSDEVLSKISVKFRKFLKDIESKTYKFKYDTNKSLNEQKLKPKTRRLLTLIYLDYLCTTTEKELYLSELNEFFEQQKKQRKDKYNTNDLFKREKIIKDKEEIAKQEQTCTDIVTYQENHTIIDKIINFFRKLIKKY